MGNFDQTAAESMEVGHRPTYCSPTSAMARGPLTSLLARVADQHEPRGRPRTLAGRVARLTAGGGHAAGSRPLRELDITRPEPSRTCGGGTVHVKAADLLRRSADVSIVAHEATLQLMQVRAWLASTGPRAGVTANQQQAVKDGGGTKEGG